MNDNLRIHFQEPRCGSPNGGASCYASAVQPKMLGPLVPARMEERRELPGIRVNARQVWAFVEVAVDAGPRKVVGIVAAAMLPGDDVFDMEILRRERMVRQAAVFTTPTRALSHEIPSCASHATPVCFK
ncbi:MAG: hypothetical protein WCS99_06225 [Limisphaerales bacterium]